MPESPMFYMVKRNEEAAKKSMRFFRGPDYEEIDDELAIFKVSVLFYLIFSISSHCPIVNLILLDITSFQLFSIVSLIILFNHNSIELIDSIKSLNNKEILECVRKSFFAG